MQLQRIQPMLASSLTTSGVNAMWAGLELGIRLVNRHTLHHGDTIESKELLESMLPIYTRTKKYRTNKI